MQVYGIAMAIEPTVVGGECEDEERCGLDGSDTGLAGD